MSGGGQRIVVIGAGIVGTSTALFLQADGHRVTLIDRLPPGGGTSSGNAGVISVGSILPVATPAVLRQVPRMLLDPLSPLAIRWTHLPRLVPWLTRLVLASRPAQVERATAALAGLVARAGQAHDVLIQRAGAGDLVRRVGWLKVAASAEALRRGLATELAAYARYELPHRLLEPGETHELEPALAPALRHGLLLPMHRAVAHPQLYVQRFADAFRREGGRVMRADVLDFPAGSGAITAVRTSEGMVEADHAVIAAGALSRRLARQAGARIPLDAERGYHAMLPHPTPTLTRPVYAVDHGFVLAPMLHGVRLTGGVELASPTAAPDWRRIRRLVGRAREVLPGLDGRIDSEWQGCRPSTPDSLPVIGRAPDRPNVWLAFGHQHVGLTLGPLTGRLIADLIAGRDPGLDLGPFAADRRYW